MNGQTDGLSPFSFIQKDKCASTIFNIVYWYFPTEEFFQSNVLIESFNWMNSMLQLNHREGSFDIYNIKYKICRTSKEFLRKSSDLAICNWSHFKCNIQKMIFVLDRVDKKHHSIALWRYVYSSALKWKHISKLLYCNVFQPTCAIKISFSQSCIQKATNCSEILTKSFKTSLWHLIDFRCATAF